MKHKGIITQLCHFLGQGYGINEALVELGLTPNYLTERIRRIDRIKLHQARAVYVEGLQRDLVNRARLGRKTGQLERALDNLPPLDLPGDDKDEEREHRQWRRRNFKDDDMKVIIDVDNSASLAEVRCLLRNSGDEEDDEDDDAIDPASEAPAAPRRRLHISATPSAVANPHPAEDTHQPPAEAVEEGVETASAEPDPEPPPESKLRWRRLYTGRAQLLDQDGKVVRSVMPGQLGYPHFSEFINRD